MSFLETHRTKVRERRIDALTQVALGLDRNRAQSAIDGLVKIRPVPVSKLTDIALHASSVVTKEAAVDALADVKPLPVHELTYLARHEWTHVDKAVQALFDHPEAGASANTIFGDRKDPPDLGCLVRCLYVDLHDESSTVSLRREAVKALRSHPNRQQVVQKLVGTAMAGLRDPINEGWIRVLEVLAELEDPDARQGVLNVYREALRREPQFDGWADPPNIVSPGVLKREREEWASRQQCLEGVLKKHHLNPATDA